MILDVCAEPNILKTMRIVKLIINFLKIIVPIILIVSASMTFTKATANGENTKAFQSLIRKIVAAAAIFLIPTIVGILLRLTNPNNGYYNCFKNATKEGIIAAYKVQAEYVLLNAKTSLTESSYAEAKSVIDSMPDSDEKNALYEELKVVKADTEKAIKERREILERQSSTIPGSGGGTGISKTGKYSKVEIIDMSEETVRAMSNQEFIEFIGSAAQIVYSEVGGVLPSITIAQAVLESGYGDHFIATTHNVYGLRGYPGSKPKVYTASGTQYLRKFENFYEATYYHATYFPTYPKSYTQFLIDCNNHQPLQAAAYLGAYAGGSKTYGPTIQKLINQYNLTQYD